MRYTFKVIIWAALISLLYSCPGTVDDAGQSQSSVSSINLQPWVSIVTPAQGQSITNPLIFSGHTGDDSAVPVVWISVDGSEFRMVEVIGTNWSTNLTGLNPGYHTNRVFATVSGNETSATNSVVFYIPAQNADLAGLSVSTGTLSPEFHRTNTNYVVYVGVNVSNNWISISAADSHAGIFLDNNPVVNGLSNQVALVGGNNYFSIRTVSEDKNHENIIVLRIYRDMYTYYIDNDNDGWGSYAQVTNSVSPVPGYVDNATDCDDTRTNVYPGASEICDTLDNDCDGLIDE